ncbi:hypothetical protein HPB48_021163 [Haemaphysalis longicornis]|uniref:SHSP domain-containing protein n=1 Tax=Haemaphysalis longicornis TaxID=44386 RepID=A0A9J6FW72_HAELO|nr:hypothetical protein HPB48_021163 [Haemaphysalis longicornis]
MAHFPLYSRGLRRFFDDDDFGGSFLDGELFDPPFYHHRFYIHPRHHRSSSSSQESSGVCPARQQTTGACPARQQTTGVCPASQKSTGVCPYRQQQGSAVACTPDKFAINVDTRHFAPEEISVKTEENCVVIHGKHEEKSDDRGCYVKREFTRRYVLPEDVDPESVKCHLKPNGFLALEAPRKNAPKKEEAEPVPVEVQHVPASGDAQK